MKECTACHEPHPSDAVACIACGSTVFAEIPVRVRAVEPPTVSLAGAAGRTEQACRIRYLRP